MRLERVIAIFGALASACVLIMLLMAFVFGVSQEFFEIVQPASKFTELILAQASALRFVFTVDNFFVLFYSGFFLAFCALYRGKVDGFVLGVAFASFLLPSLLDVFENFHILSMLRAAELGLPISDTAIQVQYIVSAMKFVISYFAAMAFAWLYPRDTQLARFVGVSTGIIYPIVGVMAYTLPMPFALIFGAGRVAFFVFAFALSAVVYWNRRESAVAVSF